MPDINKVLLLEQRSFNKHLCSGLRYDNKISKTRRLPNLDKIFLLEKGSFYERRRVPPRGVARPELAVAVIPPGIAAAGVRQHRSVPESRADGRADQAAEAQRAKRARREHVCRRAPAALVVEGPAPAEDLRADAGFQSRV